MIQALELRTGAALGACGFPLQSSPSTPPTRPPTTPTRPDWLVEEADGDALAAAVLAAVPSEVLEPAVGVPCDPPEADLAAVALAALVAPVSCASAAPWGAEAEPAPGAAPDRRAHV